MSQNEVHSKEGLSLGQRFLERIGRSDLEQRLTPLTPYCYVSPEYMIDGLNGHNGSLAAAGGLGALSGDTVLDAAGTGIPFEGVGIFHTRRVHQAIGRSDNKQYDVFEQAQPPDQLGLKKIDGLDIGIRANGQTVNLEVWDMHVGDDNSQTNIHLLYEPNLREVYPGDQHEDHRLYQMSVLGFGASQIWQQQGKEPAVLHLNESSTSLAAVGLWDRYMQKYIDGGMGEDEAMARSLADVRAKTILTNHTLVPAAEATYDKSQYDRYILENIQNEKIKERIRSLFGDRECMAILDVGMYMAGRFNGVSKLHAELATEGFAKGYEGTPITEGGRSIAIEGVTNAINRRWNERISDFYQQHGITDEFDLPTDDYKERIEALDPAALRAEKMRSKAELREWLKTREFANNDVGVGGKYAPPELPENAIVIGWARRFAGYKRPGMLFDEFEQLQTLLAAHPEAHVIYAGKAHPADEPMKREMQRILHIISSNPNLRSRIHFLQDYNTDAGRMLTSGADIWLNNPIVGKEACGTSIFKSVKSNGILVSTPDGGAADVASDNYIAIGNEWTEKGPPDIDHPDGRPIYHSDMIGKLNEAINIVKASDEVWGAHIKKQLKTFLPIVAGGRMIKDYINFALPQEMPLAV